jgi:methylated-DNA-[protein]-cysteine S-methyltransferase
MEQERPQAYRIFPTALGFCGIAWSDTGITALRLPSSSAAAAARELQRRLPGAVEAEAPAWVAAAISAATRYFEGERIEFAEVGLDLGGQEDFFARVYAAVRRLGWGETTTYGAVARALGAGPEAARDVGQAMARNPVPLIIPCHRVLAAGNKPGGFSAPGGTTAKLRMLALEGIDLAPPPAAQGSLGL